MHRTVIIASLLLQAVGFPVLNITTASTWPAKNGTFYYGDIRAVMTLPQVTGSSDESIDVQVWWRKNDMSPTKKGVVVTNSKGDHMQISVSGVTNSCGELTVSRGKHDGTQFYVYYYSHYQSGTGSIEFSWWNCTSHTDKSCVLSSTEGTCSTTLSGAKYVTGLQNRPQPKASLDHTPTGEPFHGFTQMELVASPEEVAAVVTKNPAVATFMEHRRNVIRMIHFLPVKWVVAASGSSVRSLTDNVQPGEYFTYQIGVFPTSDVFVSDVVFSDLKSASGGVISASSQNCFNTEGVDMFGKSFVKSLEVKTRNVGALWIGVDVSANVTSGSYEGQVVVVLEDGTKITHSLTLIVSGPPVENHGDDNIYNMGRLRWLNSDLGIDDTIPAPYTGIKVTEGTGSERLTLQLVNKEVVISETGLPSSSVVTTVKNVKGQQEVFTNSAFTEASEFVGTDTSGAKIRFTPVSFTSNNKPEKVTWTAVLSASVGKLFMEGSFGFDSHVVLNATFDLIKPLSDIGLSVPVKNPKYTVGMGNVGSVFKPFNWTWDASKGDNKLWLGEPQAGLIIILKGEGPKWDNPLFSSEMPLIPFIPSSWGGVNQKTGQYGASMTETGVVTTSGPRSVGVTSFLFDIILTPAKQLNMTAHWGQRYFQVGYHVGYLSPEEVKAAGATVVTLHQGTQGVVNNSLVNPYINYPFVPDTVNFMENYTRISHDLDMRVKFYYTIRELSNHAVELYALRSLGGEIITDESPYVVPPMGFCEAWNCHGGGVYLHEHLSTNYSACWQSALSNGEWDAAVCDIGSSRWFNYYIEGLRSSISKAPHMDGVYFDGINFDSRSMIRLRKVMDSSAVGKKYTPVIDIHTGNVGAISPPGPGYATYFAHADLAWNGEGFRYSDDDAYWLVEVSSLIYGIPADRLGGGDGYEFRSLVFGMTERNSPLASEVWKTWDAVGIRTSEMFSYFDPVEIQPVTLSAPNSGIKLTTYLNYKESAFICIASWSTSKEVIELSFNSVLLGGSHFKATAPGIKGLQNSTDLGDGTGKITISPGSGIAIHLIISQ